MRTPAIALFVFLSGFLLLPASASSQARIIPRAGLYASVSDLGSVDTSDGIRDVGEHETSLALGLTVELGSTSSVGLRLSGLYGTKSEIPVGGIGCSGGACDLRTTLLGLSGTLVLRPFGADLPILPYAVAGGGLKRYAFEFESGSQLKDAFGDESKGAAVLGVGIEWDLAILKGDLELVDFISGSILDGGDRQHDFFLTVGLILG